MKDFITDSHYMWASVYRNKGAKVELKKYQENSVKSQQNF